MLFVPKFVDSLPFFFLICNVNEKNLHYIEFVISVVVEMKSSSSYGPTYNRFLRIFHINNTRWNKLPKFVGFSFLSYLNYLSFILFHLIVRTRLNTLILFSNLANCYKYLIIIIQNHLSDLILFLWSPKTSPST